MGRRARLGADPVASGFTCPYLGKTCTKRAQKTGEGDEPYPVCSIWRGAKYSGVAADDLIVVCPKRFLGVDFLQAVIDRCWVGPLPANPRFASEVKMEGFGNVDFVIADISEAGDVQQFLSVELQTIDITGSVRAAYTALRDGSRLDKRPSYGFNWKNVYKRYVTQLIDKGFFHHHWNSKIVAVIPEQVYRYIRDNADFMVIPNVRDSKVNIIFMTYVLVDDPNRPGEFIPQLTTVEGTSHASLKDAVLYKQAPSRDAFVARINAALTRGKAGGS